MEDPEGSGTELYGGDDDGDSVNTDLVKFYSLVAYQKKLIFKAFGCNIHYELKIH